MAWTVLSNTVLAVAKERNSLLEQRVASEKERADRAEEKLKATAAAPGHQTIDGSGAAIDRATGWNILRRPNKEAIVFGAFSIPLDSNYDLALPKFRSAYEITLTRENGGEAPKPFSKTAQSASFHAATPAQAGFWKFVAIGFLDE